MEEGIQFTEYAKLQMREREIEYRDVLETVRSPGQILSGKKRRKTAQKRLERNRQKGLLRVILKEKAKVKIIITVYWTSKIKKYWRRT